MGLFPTGDPLVPGNAAADLRSSITEADMELYHFYRDIGLGFCRPSQGDLPTYASAIEKRYGMGG